MDFNHLAMLEEWREENDAWRMTLTKMWKERGRVWDHKLNYSKRDRAIV